MKKLAVFAIAGLMAGTLLAYPGIGGGRGLFRVQNALVEDEAGLTISLHAIGRNPTFADTTEKGWVADAIAPELSYAPLVTEWVGAELFLYWGALVQTPRSTTESELAFGMHDARTGAKLSFPYLPVLKLGATGSYQLYERDDAVAWLDPSAIPGCDGFGWTGLATLQFQDLAPSLPNLMLNYGQRECGDFYGAGVELAATGFALFAEARSLQPDSGSSGIFDTENGEIRLTPGVAFGTGNEGVTVKAAYTFSFGPEAYPSPNEVMLGLVIATPFGKRVPPQFGTIAGKVVDSRTGAGLAANVSFPEEPKLKPLTAAAATGVFTVEKVPAGVVVVEVSFEDYQTQAVPINVEDAAVAQYEFALRPLVTYGVIAGVVTDAISNQPLAATIEFPETEIASVEASASTGAFRIDDVPVGVYSVTAAAEGYFKGTLTVQVEEGRVAAPNFALTPLTQRSTFTGKISDKKTGDPLAALLSFPGSSVEPISADGATGVFMAEMPVGSYAAKVEAEGYLAQTAAVVIEKDKPTIKDFALVKEGMSITLRGIYFDFDKATIKPESHAALEDAANILRENPDIKVEIQGHTDSKGSDAYNQQLSQRRAQAVVTYLVQNFAIDPGRLTGRGYGESRPIADNSTEEGRALNRRVEFYILQSSQK